MNIDHYCTSIMCIDAEFAISLEPTNPELRKQYSDIKALHMEVKKVRNFISENFHLMFC